MTTIPSLVSPYCQPTDTNEVISRIKFIGRLKEGDKLNIRYMSIQPPSWYTKIMRTIFWYENRHTAFEFVSATINIGFDIAARMENNLHIIQDLKNACNGLRNLSKTYNDDAMFCCKLETLIQSIDTRLADLNRLQKGEEYDDQKSDY